MSVLGAIAQGISSFRNATVTQRSSYGGPPSLFRSSSSRGDQLYCENPTLFPIVSMNASKTAAVNWHMHRTKNLRSRTACEVCGEEGAVNVPVHPALTIWNRPNPFQNRQEYVESFQQHVDLSGEAFWVIEFVPGMKLPMHLWLRQPHLMCEMPGDELYQPSLVGWETRLKSGQVIEFDLEEIIQIKMPNPANPYRGIGPVQSCLKMLGYQDLAMQWQNQFYANSARSDGLMAIPGITPDELKIARSEWDQRHRGLTNSHKIAWMNKDAKWTAMQYSQDDMQFEQMYRLSEEIVRKAFNFPKWYMGEPEGSNKASSDNAKDWYNAELVVPRLNRIKQVLNDDFLTLFGSTGQGVEFVYTNPVEGNIELKNATRKSSADTFKVLIDAGVDPEDAAWQAGLPPLKMASSAAPVEEEVAA